jgi:Carboxypeptidase regulatory-like domain/TonB dependent receptor
MTATLVRFLAILVLAAPAALAQVEAGRILGTVLDPNGAAVPNATVTVTDVNKNRKYPPLTTNNSGDFVLTPVDPGNYRVEIKASGFSVAIVQNVEVVVGQSARVDAKLTIGEVTTQIEVAAVAPLLSTESGTLGQEINNKEIVDLPLNSRSFYQLASLTPGSTALPATGNVIPIRANNENGTGISGVKGQMTSFYMDGVDITDHHQGGTLIQISIDALQEFQVQQSEYTAEFRNAGGVINATTKSGTSQVHFGGFDFFTNDKLDARAFFALSRPSTKRNQFGGWIGGPLPLPKVPKHSTFFFVDYEGWRQRIGQVFNSIVPSVNEKNGIFTGLNTIYDPTTHAPFPQNIIPQNRISPQAQFFTTFIPNANAGKNAVFAPSQALDQDQFTLRLDQTINNKNRAFARWSFINYQESNPNAFPALGFTPMNSRGGNLVLALISNVTPTLINELRFNDMPNSLNLQAFLQGTNFYSQAGVAGFEDTGHRPGDAGSFPDFAWSGYASMSGSTFDQRPKTQNLRLWVVNDSMTWAKGRHILKFGGEFRRWMPRLTDSGVYEGAWTFNGSMTQNAASPSGTGDAFADYLLGIPYSVQRGYPGDPWGSNTNFWHFFVQDDFKVSDRLTLNIGLRYEYSPWLSGFEGQVGTILPQSAQPIAVQAVNLNAQSVAPLAYAEFGPQGLNLIQTCAQAGIAQNCTATDYRQFAPRFGFAWRPLGDRTVIRGGYGIFYEPESSNNRVNHNMVPYLLLETVFNTGGTRNMANYFQGQQLGASGTNPTLAGGQPNMPMGYDQHWNLGVQQTLGRNMILEVDYVGNRGVNLYEANPINDPPAGPGAVQTRRPLPLFGSITYNGQDASSFYDSLQVKYERRSANGFWYLVSYTYSKNMFTQDTPPAGGDYAYQRALASFDIPQNLTVSSGYSLPFGKARKYLANAGGFANATLGGWQVQGILTLHSGVPFTPTISRDVSNTGIGGQFPNRIGSGQLPDPTLSNWFNKADFTLPANYTYGNSGSFILRADRFKNLDFSLFKTFQAGERLRIQFRAEAFNLTNSPTFNPPGSNIDTSSGGVVTSTLSAPRNIQLALKFNF